MIFKNFQAFRTETKNGIYILTQDSCDFCRENIEQFEKEEINNLSIVDVTPIEINDCSEYIGVSTFPTTIVYKDDEILYKKGGVLYNKQLKDLKIIAQANQIKLFTEQAKRPETVVNKPMLVIGVQVGQDSLCSLKRKIVIDELKLKNKIPIFIDDLVTNIYENNFDLDLLFSILDGFDTLCFVNNGEHRHHLDTALYSQLLFHAIALQREFEILNIHIPHM